MHSESHYSSVSSQPARASDSTQLTAHSTLFPPSQSGTPVSNGGGHIAPTDNVLNRVADKDASLFQISVNLRRRLLEVPGMAERMAEVEEEAENEDENNPVNFLWRFFRKGHPLIMIYNYLRPAEPVELDPSTKDKAAAFKFVKACISQLGFASDECFILADLYGNDTSGFVKVIRVASRVVDIMISEGLITPQSTAREQAPAGLGGVKRTHRQHIVDELVRTERTYVQHLDLLQSYKKLVEERGVITGDSVHDIFLNLNALLDFQRRFLIHVETTNAYPEEEQDWGKLFVGQFADYGLHIYEIFIQNQKKCEETAMQEFQRLREAGGPPELRQMVESPTHLTSFLLKPFQRLSKYPLLLKELRDKGDMDDARKQELSAGIKNVTRSLNRANAEIAREEREQAVQDLKSQVEDWKGHRVEAFGNLLLHGTFTVTKGDPQKDEREKTRQYRMYLFEKILLCCKDVNPNKQKARIMNKPPPVSKTGKPRLQLKGRIFMQNVTDTSSLSSPMGGYTCQIFWRGDEAIEFFVIRFQTEDLMRKWRDQVETQRRTCQDQIKSQMLTNTSETEFTYMQNQGQLHNPYAEDDAVEDDEHYGEHSDPSVSRNASNTSLRSRSTTGESGPPIHAAARARQPSGYTGNPLTLRTQQLASPNERAGNSYFSPGFESPISSRGSTSSSVVFPFPRQSTPQNGWQEDQNRYTAPAMARPRGSNPTGSYATHQASLAQNRIRSASSPDIHNVNLAQNRRANNAPPVPSIPTQLTQNTNLGRSQTNSPNPPNGGLAPKSAAYGGNGRAAAGYPSQGHDGGYNGFGHDSRNITPIPIHGGTISPPLGSAPSTNGDMPLPSQLKVKVKVPSEGSTMTLVVGFNITFQSLKDRIDAKLSRHTNLSLASGSVKLKYLYDDEYISIQTDEDVQTAFETWREQQQEDIPGQLGEIELYCQR